MSLPKIGIIISSTRATRFADKPVQWLTELANARGDAHYEVIDLRDYPMPLFDAPASPRFMPIEHDVAQRWASKMAELDGYIFVTAEYNRSIPAALKNALDHIYYESHRKPAAFVGYGGVGAARAIEQLRLMCIELGMASLKSGVHIGMEPFLGVMQQGKSLSDYSYLGDSVTTMLDELAWWTDVLKNGRQSDELTKAA